MSSIASSLCQVKYWQAAYFASSPFQFQVAYFAILNACLLLLRIFPALLKLNINSVANLWSLSSSSRKSATLGRRCCMKAIWVSTVTFICQQGAKMESEEKTAWFSIYVFLVCILFCIVFYSNSFTHEPQEMEGWTRWLHKLLREYYYFEEIKLFWRT